MVLIHKQAYRDLDAIFTGMMYWEKIDLSVDFVETYIDDIVEECYKLDCLSYHVNATYYTHKLHGQKVHRYHRNPRTTWYIVYDMDAQGNIFVNRIISIYTTVE